MDVLPHGVDTGLKGEVGGGGVLARETEFGHCVELRRFHRHEGVEPYSSFQGNLVADGP